MQYHDAIRQLPHHVHLVLDQQDGVAPLGLEVAAQLVEIRLAAHFLEHEHLGADLTYSMVVGGTHWDHTAATNAAPVGPRPEFFFAPTQIAKRTKEWGQAGLDDRMAVAWTDFATWTNEWVHHVRPRGAAEVQAAFAALVRGVIDPSATIVATMAS